jgi:hypothetical protein
MQARNCLADAERLSTTMNGAGRIVSASSPHALWRAVNIPGGTIAGKNVLWPACPTRVRR